MAKDKIMLEKDEKKALIIAFVACAVVILAVVLTLIAIKRGRRNDSGVVTETVQSETGETTETSESLESTLGPTIVTTQEELDAALANPDVYEIMFQTEEEQSIIIASNNYTGKNFTIDSPYTEVENYATFNSITIKQISANTWTEHGAGNSFFVDSAQSHILIAEDASVARIENDQSASILAVEIEGTLSMLTLASSSAIVSLDNRNLLEQIVINYPLDLTITGTSENATPIDLAMSADDTKIKASMPVVISTYASMKFVCEEGAESSSVTIKNNEKKVTVTNKSKESLFVTTADGAEKKVQSGREDEEIGQTASGTTAGSGSIVSSSNGSSSSGSSSTSSSSSSSTKRPSASTGSSSSGTGSTVTTTVSSQETGTDSTQGTTSESTATTGTTVTTETKPPTQGSSTGNDKGNGTNQGENTVDKEQLMKEMQEQMNQWLQEILKEYLNPVVVGFSDEIKIYGGYVGNVLTLEEVEQFLPKTVTGITTAGLTVTIPVTEWINVNEYSLSAKAGTYQFKAVLEQTDSAQYAIKEGTIATAEVYVKSFASLTYANEYSSQISVQEYRTSELISDGSPGTVASYYVLTNTSETEVPYVSLFYYYFDVNGDVITSESVPYYGECLQPGESFVAKRIVPSVEYANYLVEVSAMNIGKEQSEKVIDSSYITEQDDLDIVDMEMETPRFDVITIKNDSQQLATEVNITLLYLDAHGKVCGYEYHRTGGDEDINPDKGEINTDSIRYPGSVSTLTFTYPEEARSKVPIIQKGGYLYVEP